MPTKKNYHTCICKPNFNPKVVNENCTILSGWLRFLILNTICSVESSSKKMRWPLWFKLIQETDVKREHFFLVDMKSWQNGHCSCLAPYSQCLPTKAFLKIDEKKLLLEMALLIIAYTRRNKKEISNKLIISIKHIMISRK